MEGAPELRILRTLGVAVVLHTAIFGAILLRKVTSPVAVTAPGTAESELTVDVESSLTPASAAATTRASAGDDGERVAMVERREVVGPTSSVEARDPSSTTVLEPGAPATSSSANPGVTFGGMGSNIGLRGPNMFLAPGALPDAPGEAPPGREPTAAEQAAESKRKVQASIRGSGQDRDRELGLGPEGPVLTALNSATSESTAPVSGRAVFLAIANGAGEVVGISVLECDGAHSDWSSAAQIALGNLKGKKLRMPSSATRAEMKIEVTSAWKLPSGHDPGADVSVLGVPVHKGEGKQSTKVTILDPIPKIRMTEIAPGVMVPVPEVHLTIIATNGDPANIGAAARRIVHSRLLASNVQ